MNIISEDDKRSAGGSFDSIVLPKRLYREFLARHLTTDKIFSSTSSRLVQDGVLVGFSSGKLPIYFLPKFLSLLSYILLNIFTEYGTASKRRYLLCSASLDTLATTRKVEKVDRNELQDSREKSYATAPPCLWVLNRYTQKWRPLKASPHPGELETVDSNGDSSVKSDSEKARLRTIPNEKNPKTSMTSDLLDYMNFWAALGVRSESAPSSGQKVQTNYGSLRALLGLALFGEHTLIVVGVRRARYFIDVMAREPLPESSAQPGGMGIPCPKVSDKITSIFCTQRN